MNPSDDPATPRSQPATPLPAWQLPGLTLTPTRIPLLMGIVNVTPDSFSDGGQFFDPGAAVAQGLRLAAEGADLLDIGGESTRPYSDPVTAEEELRRVLPVVAALARQTAVPLSIDTSKAAVARQALAAGARVIDDITGLTGDAEMVAVARHSGAAVSVMHMRGTPQTMQDAPRYDDVVEEVLAYLRQRRDALWAAGITPGRIALDPGIGFGKRTRHNVALLRAAGRFHSLGCPVLIGHSRKGFLRKILDTPQPDSLAGTLGVALALARQQIQILRVHQVKQVREALLLFAATGGLEDSGGAPPTESLL